jgi:hypothetical protein
MAYEGHLRTEKNLENAVHLYSPFEETLRSSRPERRATRLGIEDEYERLKRI